MSKSTKTKGSVSKSVKINGEARKTYLALLFVGLVWTTFWVIHFAMVKQLDIFATAGAFIVGALLLGVAASVKITKGIVLTKRLIGIALADSAVILALTSVVWYYLRILLG